MIQNTQNITYITIKIHKHNNKNTEYKKLNRSIKNTQVYRLILEVRAVPRLWESFIFGTYSVWHLDHL
jgi:hypothetical protein